MEEQEQREAMQKYQQIQQQMEQVQEYIERVEENIQELDETREAVGDLEDQEIGSEILVPVGSGVFAVGELKENEKVVTDVGADSYEKKELEDAQELLGQRKSQMEDTRDELTETIQDLQEEMQELQQKLQQARQG